MRYGGSSTSVKTASVPDSFTQQLQNLVRLFLPSEAENIMLSDRFAHVKSPLNVKSSPLLVHYGPSGCAPGS